MIIWYVLEKCWPKSVDFSVFGGGYLDSPSDPSPLQSKTRGDAPVPTSMSGGGPSTILSAPLEMDFKRDQDGWQNQQVPKHRQVLIFSEMSAHNFTRRKFRKSQPPIA